MFIVRTVLIKPAGVSWYQHDPALGSQTLQQFAAEQYAAGAYVRTRNRKIGKNKIINTTVFADQAAHNAYKAAADAHPQQQAREAYFAANGITKIVKKFQEVA